MPNERVDKYRESVSKPFDITLPSGHIFTVKKLSPLDYIREGLTDIPNEFFRFVLTAEVGKINDLSPEEEEKHLKMFEQFLTITIDKGIVDPPVMLTYEEAKKDTHLLWTEIRGDDQQFISGCITGRINPEVKKKEEKKDEGNVSE